MLEDEKYRKVKALIEEMERNTFKQREPDLLDELSNVTSNVYFLLDEFKLWAPDGTFTFPDGDTWTKEEQARFNEQGL